MKVSADRRLLNQENCVSIEFLIINTPHINVPGQNRGRRAWLMK